MLRYKASWADVPQAEQAEGPGFNHFQVGAAHQRVRKWGLSALAQSCRRRRRRSIACVLVLQLPRKERGLGKAIPCTMPWKPCLHDVS